jgi:hypothetical protein
MYWPRYTSCGLIRLGGEGDGGYLVPDCIDDCSVCFSPGVDDRASFESALLTRGIQSHLADGSISSPPEYLNYKSFVRKFIGPDTSGDYVSLADWVDEKEESECTDMILQMDVEGAEYSTILSSDSDLLSRFRVIVMELHGLNNLGNRYFFDQFSEFSNKLFRTHSPVHLHPNNNAPPRELRTTSVHNCLEVTLLRNDSHHLKMDYSEENFPLDLDAPCVPYKKDFPLSRSWYCQV